MANAPSQSLLMPVLRAVGAFAESLRHLRLTNVGDRLFRGICWSAAVLVVVLAGLLLAVLVWKSWLAIHTIGGRFLTSTIWDPEPTHRAFGALADAGHAVFGLQAAVFIGGSARHHFLHSDVAVIAC